VGEPIIERVDELPLVLHWLLQMRVAEHIDASLPYPHLNRQGLSYGQLGLLFVAYVVHARNHRLCDMAEWVAQHRVVLAQLSHWSISDSDASDDRLGDLLSAMGETEARASAVQRRQGQHLIQAYQLPSVVARYDTTSFSVTHAPDENGHAAAGLLRYGYSKDRRPDLLQFKQGLGTLDPSGIPLCTNTLAGQQADDRLYVPAWRELKETLGHSHFLYVADCKAAALSSRAQLASEQGLYLFPLPLTGKMPERLRAWVLQPPREPEPIALSPRAAGESAATVVGCGFVVELGLYGPPEAQPTPGHWIERWLVTRSDRLAQRQQHAREKRLRSTEVELQDLPQRKFSAAADLQQAAERILARRKVSDLLTLRVSETLSTQTRYVGRGRPGPQRATAEYTVCEAHLSVIRNETAIAEAQQLAGWRIHVTNVPAAQMSLAQAIAYYRDEFLVEQGMHRFKQGSLPALPLFLQIPERIRGLMLLLFIALQLLTLLEFVAHRELARRQESLRGLEPANPKRATQHPSAERMLARFQGLHWLGEQSGTHLSGKVVESLTAIQHQILDILAVPATIFALDVPGSADIYHNST
jgi:transposase